MRESSATFGKWVGVELSATNHRMLWVPEQFAHGFYVMTEYADFLYKCTDLYSPDHDQSMLWDDPEVGIEWPLVNGAAPILSEKDINAKSFADAPKF